MIDFKTAQVRRHQQNIKRYCRLLATELTGLERQYLHKRIAEEYAQLKQLEKAVVISSSQRTLPAIRLVENPNFSFAHKNKYGQDYVPPSGGTYDHP